MQVPDSDQDSDARKRDRQWSCEFMITITDYKYLPEKSLSQIKQLMIELIWKKSVVFFIIKYDF